MKLSKQKENIIKKDLDRYMMGQIQLKQISVLRKVPHYHVDKIQQKLIQEKLNGNTNSYPGRV